MSTTLNRNKFEIDLPKRFGWPLLLLTSGAVSKWGREVQRTFLPRCFHVAFNASFGVNTLYNTFTLIFRLTYLANDDCTCASRPLFWLL